MATKGKQPPVPGSSNTRSTSLEEIPYLLGLPQVVSRDCLWLDTWTGVTCWLATADYMYILMTIVLCCICRYRLETTNTDEAREWYKYLPASWRTLRCWNWLEFKVSLFQLLCKRLLGISFQFLCHAIILFCMLFIFIWTGLLIEKEISLAFLSRDTVR